MAAWPGRGWAFWISQKLLDGVPAGFVLEEDGPRYVGTDTAALAWLLGPPGKSIARGIDILRSVTAA